MSTQAPEHSVHNDSVRQSTPRAVEPASFSGAERMNLYKNFDSTVGANRSAGGSPRSEASAGRDAKLPDHLSFDNSIYHSNIYGSGLSNDGSYKVASLRDTPAPAPNGNTQSRVENQYEKEAGKFAFGDTMSSTESKEGKDKLQTLTEEIYKNGGEKGLQDLARRMSGQAVDKYGDSAFDKAPAQFDKDVATVKATENKDGSTQVQYDFAQPNSDKTNTVIFQIPKRELGTSQPEVFPDNGKETYKI